MEAVRCEECGDTRWSLFAGAAARMAGEPCQACGGVTVVERRRPGTRPRKPFVERRDRALPVPTTRHERG